MKNDYRVHLHWLALFSAMVFIRIPACSQIVNAGVKGGFNYSWTHSDNAEFRSEYNTAPVAGFNAGAVFSFQVKKRYYLHTELLYTTKGRIVTGDLALRDETKYTYFEIPLIYQIHFKGNLSKKNMREFQWYAGVGPNFSYWLGGKGTVTHFEITDHDVPEISYEIRFGERPSALRGESEYVFINEPRRIQIGINIGGGVLIEPADNRMIVVDLRFEFGHSWLGETTDYVFPDSYSNTLEARNLGLRLSLMYLLQANLDKKVRNKGKSGVTHKGKMIKKKK